ncbi:hypothetical protein EMIT0P176_10154 [Pseudomonas sp. IT-P176]
MNKSDGPDENCPVTLRPVEIAAQLAQIDANNYNNDFAYQNLPKSEHSFSGSPNELIGVWQSLPIEGLLLEKASVRYRPEWIRRPSYPITSERCRLAVATATCCPGLRPARAKKPRRPMARTARCGDSPGGANLRSRSLP